ncbi:serine carboxypeptidase-like protein, partial [Dinothrombium tinctorium]
EVSRARSLSQVHGLKNAEDVENYSGFLTVDSQYNSSLFFWFFPSKNKTAPLLLWLQGGPGSSSLFGMFYENGPFVVSEDLNILKREYSWTNAFSMLYIDNPVGAGFSFTLGREGYAENQVDIVKGLYKALQQFFRLFPEQRQNDFYIAGESYAAKYITYLSLLICLQKQKGISNLKESLNLKGVAIGNGFFDPLSYINLSETFFSRGLIDQKQANDLRRGEKKLIKLVQIGQYSKAYGLLMSLIWDVQTFTGYSSLENVLHSHNSEDENNYKNYLNLPEVRKAIHVGKLRFDEPSVMVKYYLQDDFMQSNKVILERLLNFNIKILIYNGNLDLLVPTASQEMLLGSLNWKFSEEFKRAKREIWQNERGFIIGYKKRARNLSFISIRNAGHLVPHDEPLYAFEMIKKFVEN